MTVSRFRGRVALVTGASRGIGASLAAALAAEGAAVACAARTERVWDERLPGTIHDTVDAIRRSGGQAIAVRCDLTVDDDIVDLAAIVARELGPADILVNNAALTVPGRPQLRQHRRRRHRCRPPRRVRRRLPLLLAQPGRRVSWTSR